MAQKISHRAELVPLCIKIQLPDGHLLRSLILTANGTKAICTLKGGNAAFCAYTCGTRASARIGEPVPFFIFNGAAIRIAPLGGN